MLTMTTYWTAPIPEHEYSLLYIGLYTTQCGYNWDVSNEFTTQASAEPSVGPAHIISGVISRWEYNS